MMRNMLLWSTALANNDTSYCEHIWWLALWRWPFHRDIPHACLACAVLTQRLAWGSRAAKKRGVRAATAADEMPPVRPKRGVPTMASLGVMDSDRMADAALHQYWDPLGCLPCKPITHILEQCFPPSECQCQG